MLPIRFLLILEGSRQPLETVHDTLTIDSASRLNEPVAVPEQGQPQLVSDLGGVQGARHVLLVGEHQETGVSQTVVCQDPLQLLPRLLHPQAVGTVHHEDDAVAVVKVVLPQRSYLGLAPDVPDSEVDVFVLHCLHVKADGRNCGDNLAQLQLVQHGRLAGIVEAEHDDSTRSSREESFYQG